MENYIGKRIATLRKYHGWTQSQLAERLHISDKAVSKWESNRGDPSIELLCALADMFNCSLDYLIRGKEEFAIKRQCENRIVLCKSEVDAERVYNEALDFVKNEATALNYELAISKLTPIKIDGEIFVFSVPSFNIKDFIKRNCYWTLLSSLQKVSEKISKLHILVEDILSEPYLKEAIEHAIQNNCVNISSLQRNLCIGYPTAADLFTTMEQMNFISKANGRNYREVLINKDEFDNLCERMRY